MAKKRNQKQDDKKKHITSASEQSPGQASISQALNQAVLLHQQHKLEEAANIYRSVLARDKNHFHALHLFGSVYAELGNHGEAVTLFKQALKQNPDAENVYYNLGLALYALKQYEEAIANYRRALAINPVYALAHINLGVALNELKQFEQASSSLRRAVEIIPTSAQAHTNLGIALNGLKQYEEAIASFRRSLGLYPKAAQTWHNLGIALHELKQYEEAIVCFRRALELNPGHADSYHGLGVALNGLKRYKEALNNYRLALAISPDNNKAFYGMAYDLRKICDWSTFTEVEREISKRVRDGSPGGYPFHFRCWSDDPADLLRSSQIHTRNKIKLDITPLSPNPAHENGPIRIAYISSNFSEHPNSYLTAELYELHNRDNYEVLGIYIGPHPDDASPIRQRLEQAFDRFFKVGHMSDLEVAQLITQQRVHIAVDLMGYTKYARPRIFSYRPAPIQVNYLSFPGTMGASFMDYIFVDPFVVPPDQQDFFSERLVHLPDCYQVNDSKRVIAQKTPARIACGLPQQGFVFCSFNNSYKLTPVMFDIWMRLLRAIPGSVLWLLEDNEWMRDNLCREMQAREIDPGRLVFAPKVPLAEHLARHRLADLFLDTLPYNAHTTASDALWAGLPMVTCAGRSFASRVGGSLLHAIGLPELVTESLEAYESLALQLAQEPNHLKTVREKLMRNRDTMPLFDSKRFCRHMEIAYTEMWRTWRQGLPPKSFAVNNVGPVLTGHACE